MAVKKVVRKKDKKKTPLKKAVNKIEIDLMDEPTEISECLSDYIWLIYGARKIGKTKLLSEFDGAYFAMFDPINTGLKLRQTYIPTWRHFLKFLDKIEKKMKTNPDYIKMLVLDTGFMCYERCYQYMVKEVLGIEHAQNNDRGLAWKEISREFMEAHDRILRMNIGFAVTAHSDIVEIKQRTGGTYNKLTTQLGSQAFKFYNGGADVIAYYEYDNKGERQLIIKGDELIDAGIRIDEHFFYPDGKHIHTIPMGKS